MKRKLNERDVPEETAQDKKAKVVVPVPTFASFGLDARLLQVVKREKFATPTPVQRRAIPLAIDRQNVLARAKTGTGKTLAYILPVLNAVLRRKTAAVKSARHTTVLILVPTKELATQVTATLSTFTSFCAHDVRFENISRKEDAAVTKARLAEVPDIVVATPGRATQWINSEDIRLDELEHLVVDEADLVLSYDYEEDLKSIAAALPAGVQKILMSATLRAEVDTLTSLLFKDGEKPTILDLSSEEANDKAKLSQYVVRSAEEDKFLLIYTIFKLQLIKGKVIIFVADIDRCYRVKLFLEQFGIRSCILNSELPVNSRLHVVEEFNKGVYDIIVAADENEVVANESSKKRKSAKIVGSEAEEEEEEEDTPQQQALKDVTSSTQNPTSPARKAKSQQRSRKDREFGVARGIDFRNVSCVLNFDLPTTSKSYTHRIGRTARAGQAGMALSFFVPKNLYRKHKSTSIAQCENDEEVVEKIRAKQEERGSKLEDWNFDMAKLEAFRYRFADALRSVTRIAVREARTKELRQELIKSEKLRRHFEENPEDLQHLRHDTESHSVRAQPHLKHIPEYLLPAGGKQAVAKDIGHVSLRKDKVNRLRKARALNRSRGKGASAKGNGLDPLKSLNARGRGKK